MKVNDQKMGSDSNCNSYYNVEQNTITTQYYQTPENNSNHITMRNLNNEWINSEHNSEKNSNKNSESDTEMRQNSEQSLRQNDNKSNRNYNQPPHQQLPGPQWQFAGALSNSYQRLYDENHYGIIQPSNTLLPTSSTSALLNADIQARNHHHIHQLQSNQHLKKIYYQGLNNLLKLHFLKSIPSRYVYFVIKYC